MNKVFFKIIIPNYNNYLYIKRCLDSILNQSFQDFKIIIVDDQSTDQSYRICKIYEKRYPDKIIVIRPEEKLYAGGCRNVGIDYEIDSEYTWFVDGDDYIEENALQILYDNVNDKSDILIFNAITIKGENIQQYHNYQFSQKDCEQITKSPLRVPWIKITKSNITQKFLNDTLYGEDSYQWLKQIDVIKSYKQINTNLYYYNIREGSISHGNTERNKTRDIFIFALKSLYTEIKNTYIKKSIINRIKNENENINDLIFQKTEQKNKILIITSGSENLKYQYEVTNINKMDYCKNHDIDFIFYKDLNDQKISYHTRKDLILQNIAENKYEWIMWMDCDAWFNNPCLDINDIINNISDDNTHLIVCNDCATELRKNKFSSYHDCYINSGVLIFKSSEISKQMIDIWKNPSEDQIMWMKTKTQLNDQPYLSINILWNPLFIKHTKRIDYNIMNTFVGYNITHNISNNFILHAAGRNKPELFEKWKQEFDIENRCK